MATTNTQFIEAAFKAGLTEDQVRQAVAERNQAAPQDTSQQGGGFLENIARSIALPFITTGRVIGAGGFEALESAGMLGRRAGSAVRKGVTGEQQPPVQRRQNPLLSENEAQEISGNPLGFIGGQVGRSAQIASFGIPVGGGGAATAAGRIGKAALGGAAVGGVRGFTQGAETIIPEENLTLEQRLENTLSGAAIGGAVGGGLQAGGEAGKVALKSIRNFSENVQRKLVNQILRLPKGKVQVVKDSNGFIVSPGNKAQEFLREKVNSGDIKLSSYQNMHNEAVKKISSLETDIGNELSKNVAVNKTTTISTFVNQLDDLAGQAKSAGNIPKSNAILKIKEEFIATHGKDAVFNPAQALELRRLIEGDKSQTLLRSGLGGLDDIANGRTQAQLSVSNSIRLWLRSKGVVGGKVGDLLQDQSGYFTLRDTFASAFKAGQTRTSFRSLGFLDPLTRGIGHAIDRPSVLGKGLGQLGLGGKALTPGQEALKRTIDEAGRKGIRQAGSVPLGEAGVNSLIQLLTGNQ